MTAWQLTTETKHFVPTRVVLQINNKSETHSMYMNIVHTCPSVAHVVCILYKVYVTIWLCSFIKTIARQRACVLCKQ